MRAGAKLVELPNGHSYWYPRHHLSADPGIVRYLVSMVDENPEVTINDFGAGVGQYGHELMAARPKAKYLGYDGAGNVEHFTHQPAPARVNLQTMRKTPPWGSRERILLQVPPVVRPHQATGPSQGRLGDVARGRRARAPRLRAHGLPTVRNHRLRERHAGRPHRSSETSTRTTPRA